jgi:hypothetical protein
MEDLDMPNRSARTLVTFLLDRTGSMEAIRDDTIGGFNAYLDTLKGDGAANIEFSLVQFDSMSIDKICVAVPVAHVEKLTRETYQPRASTPLIDAAYKTIAAVEASLASRPAEKVVICIQTDGHENASTEHSWNELNALVKEKAAKGWQFNFMGVGIDAYDQAAQMGISPAATVAYDHTSPAATHAVFKASARSARRFADGAAPTTAYKPAEKAAAGDHFAGAFSGLFSRTPKSGKTETTAKRELKKAIVDDISL